MPEPIIPDYQYRIVSTEEAEPYEIGGTRTFDLTEAESVRAQLQSRADTNPWGWSEGDKPEYRIERSTYHPQRSEFGPWEPMS